MTEHIDTPGDTTDPSPSDQAETATTTPDLDAIRELVLRAHPNVIPELIAGDSIDAILASVSPAQVAYQRLADQLGTAQAAPSVPAGGDRPMPVDPERLPASEKIRRGLARRS